MTELDLDAISEDVTMAARSPEMARHVALDHAPQLIARVRELEAVMREVAAYSEENGTPHDIEAILKDIIGKVVA